MARHKAFAVIKADPHLRKRNIEAALADVLRVVWFNFNSFRYCLKEIDVAIFRTVYAFVSLRIILKDEYGRVHHKADTVIYPYIVYYAYIHWSKSFHGWCYS